MLFVQVGENEYQTQSPASHFMKTRLLTDPKIFMVDLRLCTSGASSPDGKNLNTLARKCPGLTLCTVWKRRKGG